MKTTTKRAAKKSNICSGAGTWCPVGSTKTHRVWFEGVPSDCCEACATDCKARGYADKVEALTAKAAA